MSHEEFKLNSKYENLSTKAYYQNRVHLLKYSKISTKVKVSSKLTLTENWNLGLEYLPERLTSDIPTIWKNYLSLKIG